MEQIVLVRNHLGNETFQQVTIIALSDLTLRSYQFSGIDVAAPYNLQQNKQVLLIILRIQSV